jgi:hypothetical protein
LPHEKELTMFFRARIAAIAASLVLLSVFASACAEPTIGAKPAQSHPAPRAGRDRF